MQKLYKVTLTSNTDDNRTPLFTTVVCGSYDTGKQRKDGSTVYRPLTKAMAITVAYERFFGSDTLETFRMEQASWDYNGRPVFVCDNISLATFAKLSSSMQQHLTKVDAIVDVVTLKGVGVDSLTKRNPDGSKKRTHKASKAPKADAPKAPKADAPKAPKADAPKAPKADAPKAPKADAPKADAPKASVRSRIRKAA